MRSSVVVDTDVVSFLFKRDSRAELYRPHLTGRLLAVSFMTVAELDLWALQRRWGAEQRARMDEHLRHFVVHPADRALCRTWAEVSHQARRSGRPLTTADAWIAATAVLHGIPLITHNRSDFAVVSDLVVVSESTG